ncbi:MAG: hypothetical protein IPK26_05940 [Planctomycetes bacterium]|nr:hypothetical protein [Planctomycetota bacterium]
MLAIALALTDVIAAQDLAWAVPAHGAVEYRREFTAASGTAPTQVEASRLAVKGKVPDGLLPVLLPAPWLCHGELTADRRAVADEPRSLPDLMRAVAFDLRSRGQRRYYRLLPFGDLVLSGRVDAPGPDGVQRFTLKVTTEDPEVRPGESKASLQRFIRPLCKWQAAGELQVERLVSAQDGLVREFTVRLELVFAEKDDRFRKLVLADRWQLVAVRDNQDTEFRVAVARAIERGAGWIHGELANGRRRYLRDSRENRSYGSGRLALALLTLLHAGTPHDDAVLVASLDELRKRELIDSYSLGLALMVLAERHTPPGERERLRSGVLAAPAPRELDDTDRALAAAWTARLRTNIDRRVDAAYRLRFNYVPGARFDNSVNQYALLGLHAAMLCKVEVPATVWRAAAAHLLDVQCSDEGRDLRLSLTTYRALRAAAAEATAGTVAPGVPVKARGFAYQMPDKPAYGSMTTAGVTGLVIARAGLVQCGLERANVMPKIDEAIEQAFAWLAAEFTVRSNSGFVGRADEHWYYFLYGLERASELASIARIQGRDWYFEGALQLLGRQRADGSFPADHRDGESVDATCFAVLFLKRATQPVLTGR